MLFYEYIRALFYLFLFKGKVCTRKMSVNRKLVYFEFLVFFRGILGGGFDDQDGCLKLFGTSVGLCKGVPMIYSLTIFEGGACQLRI